MHPVGRPSGSALVGLILLLLLAAGACSGQGAGDGPGGGGPAPSPDPGLNEFLQDCQTHTGTWREGEVAYPGQLPLKSGGSATYSATVDVRNVPMNPTAIPGNSTRTEPIIAQCTIAARLVPVGDQVTTSPSDWIVREFNPSGKVDWSWTVSTSSAHDQQVRLELQPALRTKDGQTYVGTSGPQVTSFTSEIIVEASFPQQIAQWITDNKVASGVIAVALVGLLGFLVSLLGSANKIKNAWRQLRDSRRGDEGPEDSPDDEDPPAPAPHRAADDNG